MGFLDNIAEKEYERQRLQGGPVGGGPNPFDKKDTALVGLVPLGPLTSEGPGKSSKATGRALLNFFTFGGLTRRYQDLQELEKADIAAGERVKSLEEFQRELQRTLQQGAEIQQERMTFI